MYDRQMEQNQPIQINNELRMEIQLEPIIIGITICNMCRVVNNNKQCCMLSFGQFPGVWILYADVSEHCSIFIGR